MTIIKDQPHPMPAARATRLAAKLQQDDPDWRYVVEHDPKGSGMALIRVYDQKDLVGTI